MENNKNDNNSNNNSQPKRLTFEEMIAYFRSKGHDVKIGTRTGGFMMPSSGKPAIKKKSGKRY